MILVLAGSSGRVVATESEGLKERHKWVGDWVVVIC